MKIRTLTVSLAGLMLLALPIHAETSCAMKHGEAADHAAHEKNCPMKGEHVAQKNCPMKGEHATSVKDVQLTGTVLCRHCDLHQSETCQKVFRSNDEAATVYDICPESAIDPETLEGEVTVSGKLMSCEDHGKAMLRIEAVQKAAAVPGA